jgi:hypothetical protein
MNRLLSLQTPRPLGSTIGNRSWSSSTPARPGWHFGPTPRSLELAPSLPGRIGKQESATM